MSEIDEQLEIAVEAIDASAQALSVSSPSRRRLVKLGTAAVPVVATLASRPALAWQCQSPSAWGSVQINPNTSLKTNAGHAFHTDETWSIANWKNNTTRLSYPLPWTKFFDTYTTVITSPLRDPSKVTISHLTSRGFVVPAGTTGYVQPQLNATYLGAVIVAQLNFVLTPSSTLGSCVDLAGLKAMAGHTGPYSNLTLWPDENIRVYLHNNYLARTS